MMGLRRGQRETHAVKTATVCANTRAKFKTLRQILQFWYPVSTASFQGERKRWCGFTYQWVVGITGRNREADKSIGFILVILQSNVSGSQSNFCFRGGKRMTYDEPGEHRQVRGLRQYHGRTS